MTGYNYKVAKTCIVGSYENALDFFPPSFILSLSVSRMLMKTNTHFDAGHICNFCCTSLYPDRVAPGNICCFLYECFAECLGCRVI